MYESQGVSLSAALMEVEEAKARILSLEKQGVQTGADKSETQAVPTSKVFFVKTF